MSWKSRAVPVDQETPKSSWKERAELVTPDVSKFESIVRGGAQGLPLVGSYADEATGLLESAFSSKTYKQARDESRANYKDAEAANPVSYNSANIAAGLPMDVAKAIPLLGQAAGAVEGGIYGLGASEADLTEGEYGQAALDTGTSAAIGAIVPKALSKAGKIVGKGASKVGQALPEIASSKMGQGAKELFNKGTAKAAKLLSGLDDDAGKFYINDHALSRAMEDEGAILQAGKRISDEISDTGASFGKEVSRAREQFLSKRGTETVPGIGSNLSNSIDNFLQRNSPSQKGFSALDSKQIKELENMSNILKGGDLTGEDLVKVRDYLDQVEGLAKKYDKEGTGPYINFLKSLRHEADQFLDRISPEINTANTNFANFKSDSDLLKGFSREGQMESAASNLFGANKTAQQGAAKRILSKDAFKNAEAISANKAANVQGPAGSEWGARRIIGAFGALPTGGASLVATDPKAWKAGLRTMGRVEDKIGYLLDKAPQALGKFEKPLRNASERGGSGVAATHFILQQTQPEYREMLKSLEEDQDSGNGEK